MQYSTLAMANRILFFICFFSSGVFAQMDIVTKALGHANGAALVNPPMPSVYGERGDFSLGLQLGFIDVTAPAEGDVKSLNYDGYNFASTYNYMFSNHWGLFALGSITQIEGGLTAPGENNGLSTIRSSNIESRLYLLGGGATYHLLRTEFLTIPLFTGPIYILGDISATFVQSNSGGTVTDDFDASSSPSTPGWIAGVQAAFNFSKHLSMVPYFLMLQPFSENGKCQKFNADQVRVSGSLFDQSSSGCSSNSGGNGSSEAEFDIFVQSFGLNIVFPTVGLSVTLLTESGDVPFFAGTKVDFYSLAFTLGAP